MPNKFGGLVLNAQDEARGAIIMLISGSGRVVFLSVITSELVAA